MVFEKFVAKWPQARQLFYSGLPLYIPAERFLISAISDSLLGLIRNQVALPKSITDFGADYEIARKNISELKIVSLNLTFKHENGRDRVYFNDNQSISLSESSSGCQSLIPLNVYIEYFNRQKLYNHSFIIEEPELNLYPITQKELIYYLANRCTKEQDKLLMTTHSPYILAALNNLIFAYKIAQKHPDKADEVAKIVPRESWLNPDDFAAYFVADGTARAIINPKTGMIAENELDGVSEDFKIEFDELVEIYRLPVHETVY